MDANKHEFTGKSGSETRAVFAGSESSASLRLASCDADSVPAFNVVPRRSSRSKTGSTFKRQVLLLVALLPAWELPASAGPSFYPLRPADDQAVYLESPAFPVKADGVADDSSAVQAAIDRVQEQTRRGIVFIPEGRYRLTKALQVWSGIRLIGYGAKRPVFVLGRIRPVTKREQANISCTSSVTARR